MDKEFYLDQVTSQYRAKPKFISWLSALIDKVDSSSSILERIQDEFDIDNATGVQLDTLGKIIGKKREVSFVPTDGSSPVLSDEVYRTLLKAKAVNNIWKGNTDQLSPVWEGLFPNSKILVQDNQDMTMDVAIFGLMPSIIRDLIDKGYVVPKPQSVGINYIYYSDVGKPVFGYDIDNEFISGYDKAVWATTKDLAVFGYDQNDTKIAGYDEGLW